MRDLPQCTLLLSLVLAVTNGPAQPYSVLHTFTGDDGRTPGPIVVSGPVLYGTCYTGGAEGGTLYRMNTNGAAFTVLHHFAWSVGYGPQSFLHAGTTLYGTAYWGGSSNGGIVFSIQTNGANFTVLKEFSVASNGLHPQGLTLFGSSLYGTTSGGGSAARGVLFKLQTNGIGFSVLKDFTTYADGSEPQDPVVQDGTFYGTCLAGGSSYGGTLFRLGTDGTQFSVIRNLVPSEGHFPHSLLLFGSALYGVTSYGGIGWNGSTGSGYGTAFKVGTNGSGFAVLKQFDNTNGAGPVQLTWSGNKFYGITRAGGRYDRGTLFEMASDGSGFTVLESFSESMGAIPQGLACSGSTFFGTTSGGLFGLGVVYSRAVGLLGPVVSVAPRSQTVEKGGTVEFTVEATGHPSFRWFFNDTTPIPGGTGPRLLLTNVQPSHAGRYTVTLSNSVRTVTSPVAVLEVVPLTISSGPKSQTIEEGGVAEFSIQIVGSAQSCRWYHNETNLLTTVTNPVLRFDPVHLENAGQYTVVVANDMGSVTSAPAILTVIPLGTVPVAYCEEGALRAAIAGSAPVTFACDGTIALSRPIAITKDTIIDGRGRAISIGSSDSGRIFEVPTNTVLTLANVTITHGRSTNGGGIYVDGGTLILLDSILTANTATNASGDACGGAIFNAAGVVNATNCSFTSNQAAGAPGADPWTYMANQSDRKGGFGKGGAVYNAGAFNAARCSFAQNFASGGGGGAGWNEAVFMGEGWSYGGGAGGRAAGGAVWTIGSASIAESALVNNAAIGGPGGFGGSGTQYAPCQPIMHGTGGGWGGDASGAALHNEGAANLVNCTVAGNNVIGGQGGGGGGSGSIYCHGGGFTAGGAGGNGGSALGAACSTNGVLTLINCTVAANTALPGSGGASGGAGYIVYYNPPDSTVPIRIDFPAPPAGSDGVGAGGIAFSASLLSTLVASNAPINFRATVVDLGHNLSSDDSGAFTAIGSRTNVDPRLGPLANCGGPTPVMPLLPGSPAIDAADDALAPSTDQRDIPRPVGSHSDIGAFEFTALLQIQQGPANTLNILVCGPAGASCTLLIASPADWHPVATKQIGPDGTALFQQTLEPGPNIHLYRVSLP